MLRPRLSSTWSTPGNRCWPPPPRCRSRSPHSTPYASAGQLSVSLDTETTRSLLGEVPAAFHAGIQDILLIAFGLACGGIPGHRMRADQHRCGVPRAR